MSKTASLALHSYKQPHQGAQRLSEGLGILISFVAGKRVIKAAMQWLAIAQVRRRQSDELAAYWEAANHDPRIMCDYIAAQTRGEQAQVDTTVALSLPCAIASPIVASVSNNRFVAYF